MEFPFQIPPCVVFEDAHGLVARRPAGWSRETKGGYSPAGFTDWLRRREVRWRNLRFEKEISLNGDILTIYSIGSRLAEQWPGFHSLAAQSGVDLRDAVIHEDETNVYRLLHGAADGCPGQHVERLGEWLLWETEDPDSDEPPSVRGAAKGVYKKLLRRHVRATGIEDAAPKLVRGEAAPDRFHALENGLRFELSFVEGYSYGLFPDQRDNRRALMRGHVAPGFSWFEGGLSGRLVLNAFSYTCAFSVCAGMAGAVTTSLDLSRKYLDWGRRNFSVNGLDAGGHDFIYGDVFDWFRRLRNKGRRFDLVMLDPPTFSKARKKAVFKADRDYAELVELAVALVATGGILFCSTNAAGWSAAAFREAIEAGVRSGGRRVMDECFAGQSPDFPVTSEQPAYLKTFWLRLD
ncbi:MAG: class I SAM-dependent rRNA methyltransferase [Verrucomicrobiae bacterium]|nr:class I SAM-dependent rRNA methyltransferase [Verrucomicrobiae bacterium]